jgi:hypothetical protein
LLTPAIDEDENDLIRHETKIHLTPFSNNVQVTYDIDAIYGVIFHDLIINVIHSNLCLSISKRSKVYAKKFYVDKIRIDRFNYIKLATLKNHLHGLSLFLFFEDDDFEYSKVKKTIGKLIGKKNN